MIVAAICEDDPLQAERLLDVLKKYQASRPGVELDTHAFCSGSEMLEAMEAGASFEFFLLDVLMPGLNGIELARELRSRDEGAPLIFLTSSSDYALEAFSVSAIQYILKPIDENTFFPVLDKAIAQLNHNGESTLLLTTPEGKVRVLLSAIACVESVGRTLRVYLENGEHLYTRTIRVPFAEAVAPLLNDDAFLHAHKSFILNMSLVEKLTNSSFIMKGGAEVPVPRYKYAGAKARYMEYLSSRGIESLGGSK